MQEVNLVNAPVRGRLNHFQKCNHSLFNINYGNA